MPAGVFVSVFHPESHEKKQRRFNVKYSLHIIYAVLITFYIHFAWTQNLPEARDSQQGPAVKEFSVDFNSVLGTIKPLTGVTAGPGDALQGYKDAHITMIRTNDYYGPCDFPTYSEFFSNGSINPNFDPTDPGQYHWKSTDDILSVHYANGFETFFRLGISFNLTKKSPYWDPPYDYGDTTYTNISEVFKRTVMHYNDGWDNGFHYGIKYWNIWTEPDGGFWNRSVSDTTYYRMYTDVSKTLKNYDATLKVGGPGLLSGSVVSKRPWVNHFIDYCRTHDAPLDFLSWHLYSQHNPYAVQVYADYIRGLLDDAGFTETENVISESNISLGHDNYPYVNTPRHAAWFASMLITAQNAPLDRLIMYRGDKFMNLVKADSAGLPVYTWSGLGFKTFAVLADEAPIQVQALGSEYVDNPDSLRFETKNIMIMATKDSENTACYVLISNYHSGYDQFTVDMTNLPWTASDSVWVTQYRVDESHPFVESASRYPGGDQMTLTLADRASPSITLLKISRENTTGIGTTPHPAGNFILYKNYPNPFNPTTTIRFQLPVAAGVRLAIYDIRGQLVRTLVHDVQSAGLHTVSWDGRDDRGKDVASGIYLYRLQAGTLAQTRSMILLR